MKLSSEVMVSGVSGASQFGGGGGGDDGLVCPFLILGGGGGSGGDDSEEMWKEGLPWWRKNNDHRVMEVPEMEVQVGEDGGVEL